MGVHMEKGTGAEGSGNWGMAVRKAGRRTSQEDGYSVPLRPKQYDSQMTRDGRGGSSPATVRVFGGMGLAVADGPLSIGGPRQRRLLALLALRNGSAATVDWLAEYLWDDADRPKATAPAIRTYVSRLRQALPEEVQDWLRTESSGYLLNAPSTALEHLQFSELRTQAAAARSGDDPLSAMRLLDEALELWRGDPFQELEDSDVARPTVEQLHLDRLEMFEERWESALALGRHTQITGELAIFAGEHRLRDRATRQYALALHRSGRSPEGLRVIAAHREFLLNEAGLDPSSEMLKLEGAMLAGDASLEVEKTGRPLRGYRLLDEIGNGAFSVVWRGLQPSVGREVAIKQIRSELASQPEFIRRFEAEAHLVARLEHPHIVPLIDFWRDPDSAYLVMRLLRGDTLERRLDDGALTVEETMVLARQIGGALSTAHARGIVHRDVKTANILFDEQDNAFLGDFGIALEATKSAGPEAALSPGSPVYASPEQIRGERLSPESDVFSFGVVIFECLTGSLPFPPASSVEEMIDRQLYSRYPTLAELGIDVPDSISSAVATATSKNASDRFASVDDFIAALMGLSDESVTHESTDPQSSAAVSAASNELANPYLGLRAFDDGDSARFFGRVRLVNEIVGRLASKSVSSRCVVVVGPSGSGKSSVVRAGLMPALRGGAVEGSSDWFTTTMVPGADPFESLEAALLRVAVNPPSSLLGQLRDGPRGILRSVRRCLGTDTEQLMVVIDQFEEIFTRSSRKTADDFLEALAIAVEDPTSPLKLVATLRADYYDRPLEHPTFARVLTAASVDVTPLAADELEQAIVEPARQLGVTFEPGLVAQLAAETVGQPSPLPLLQYTLSELFDRRHFNELTIDAYHDIGGLAGALSSRADAIQERADTTQRSAIRRIFGRMTSSHEGSADLRQRVPVADLGADDATQWVLEQFGSARLISFDRDVTSREPTVEVAHEALLREWPRLARWLSEDRDILRTADAIASAATSWDGGGREPSDLYRGGRLEGAIDLSIASPDRLRPIDMEFVGSSRSAAEAARAMETRRVKRLRALVTGVGAALVLALIAGGVAFNQGQRADGEAETARAAAAEASTQAELALAAAEDAELATLISRSASLSNDDPDVSILLALEAHRRSPEPATERGLLNAITNSPRLNLVASFPFLDLPAACGRGAILSPDGLTQYGVVDRRFVRQDLVTGEVTDHGEAPERCAVWTGDEVADRVFVSSQEEPTTIWLGTFDDPMKTEIVFELPTFFQLSSFASDRLVMEIPEGEEDSDAIIIDATTGAQIGRPIPTNGTWPVAMSGDGAFAVFHYFDEEDPNGRRSITVADGRSGEEIFEVEIDAAATGLTLDDSTGELLAMLDQTKLITVDLETGEIISSVRTGATASLDAMNVRADGLVTAVSSGYMELVDRRSGPTGTNIEVSKYTDAIASSRIRPDGSVVLSRVGNPLEVYDFDANARVRQSWATDTPALEIVINQGQAGIVRGPNLLEEVIDLATGDRTTFDVVDSTGQPFDPLFIRPDPDGFWTLSPTGKLSRWEDGQIVDQIEVDGEPLFGDFHGDLVADVRERDGERWAVLVNLKSGVAGLNLEIPAQDASAVLPSVSGGLHVLDSDGTFKTYDPSGEQISQFNSGVALANQLAIDPTSGSIAVAVFPAGVSIIDPVTGSVRRLAVNTIVSNISFVRNGQYLAMIMADGAVFLWDVARDQLVGQLAAGSIVPSAPLLFYDESDESIWATTPERLIQLPTNGESWVRQACGLAQRDLTQDEWDRYVPGDEPLTSACG